MDDKAQLIKDGEDKSLSAFSLSLLFSFALLLVYLHLLFKFNDEALFVLPYLMILYFLAIFNSPRPALCALISQLGALVVVFLVAPLIYLHYPEYMSSDALFLQGEFFVFLSMAGVVFTITLLWNVVAGFLSVTRARQELVGALPAEQIKPEEGLSLAEIRQLPQRAKPHFLYGELQWALIEKIRKFYQMTNKRTKWLVGLALVLICALWYTCVLFLFDTSSFRYERDRARVSEWSSAFSSDLEYMQQLNALSRMIEQPARFEGKAITEVRNALGLEEYPNWVDYYLGSEKFTDELMPDLAANEKLLVLWPESGAKQGYALIAEMDAAGKHVQKLRLEPSRISRDEMTRFSAQQDLLRHIR